MIIFGTRVFGTTYAVPGVFYVATRFFHVDFVPLIPTTSYMVICTGQTQFVKQIPVNCSSVGVAWIRFAAAFAVFISILWSFIAWLDDYTSMQNRLTALLCVAVTGFLCYQANFHPYLNNATYEQATSLLDLHFPDDTREGRALRLLVHRHFQQQGQFGTIPTNEVPFADASVDVSSEDDPGLSGDSPVVVAEAAEISDLELAEMSTMRPSNEKRDVVSSHPVV